MPRGIVCWCKKGMMSQCTAPSRPEQIACHFYDKSMVAERCMHCIESLNNHCDCHRAQVFGHHPPGQENFDSDFDFEEEISLTELVEAVPERNCINCILYTCSYVIHENQQAQPRGGLNVDDLTHIASKCEDYEDEETMQAKINISLRGGKP